MWLFQFLLALLQPIVVTPRPNKVTAAKDGLKLVQKGMEKGKWNEANGIEKRQRVFMTEIELADPSLQINEKLLKYLSK